MQRILIIPFLLFALQLSIQAQGSNAFIMDASGMCKSYVVARDPEAYLDSPSAVQSVTNHNDWYTAYIKRDSLSHIIVAKSSDDGVTWRDVAAYKSPESLDEYHSISMFSLGKTYFKTARNKRKLLAKNSLVMFAGGVPLYSSRTVDHEYGFYELSPAMDFGAYRVTGLTQLKDGRVMALFHDDGRFVYADKDDVKLRKSIIYKVYSSDGGKTWTNPEIALRHNVHGLYDAAIFRSPRKRDKELVMITSERGTSEVYISFSTDEGESWTYPHRLPDMICGDRFGVAVVKKELYIVYRDLSRVLTDGTVNPYFGDIVLWTGDMKELLGGNDYGMKMRIADNFPADEDDEIDHDDIKYYDCGYASVLPMHEHRLSIVAYGHWERGHMPYVKNFILDTKELKRIKRKM